MGSLDLLDKTIIAKVEGLLSGRDPAHDLEHVMRVCHNAELIGDRENANMKILLAAALLHDIVVYPKGSAKTSKSADDSADFAEKLLNSNGGYSENEIEKISYCIRTHSYSKKITPTTLEGKILQDADRLDALGAIGIARTFGVGGSENRAIYNAADPFCLSGRDLDDRAWTLDHFKLKLLKLKDSMHTETAKRLSKERTEFMISFMTQLEREIRFNGQNAQPTSAHKPSYRLKKS